MVLISKTVRILPNQWPLQHLAPPLPVNKRPVIVIRRLQLISNKSVHENHYVFPLKNCKQVVVSTENSSEPILLVFVQKTLHSDSQQGVRAELAGRVHRVVNDYELVLRTVSYNGLLEKGKSVLYFLSR